MALARCADERARDARIEHHRHLAGRDLARIEPRDRALAGAAADLLRALRDRRRAAPRRNRSRAPCRCLRRRSPASRCRGASRDRRREKPWLVTSTMPPMPAEAEAPPDLADALDRKRRPASARARHGPRALRPSADRGRSGRDRGNRAPAALGRRARRYLSSGAARAIATARSASAARRRRSGRWWRPPPAACRPARAGRVVAFGALAIPRPRRRAPRPTATPSAPPPRRRRRRRPRARPRPAARRARSARTGRTRSVAGASMMDGVSHGVRIARNRAVQPRLRTICARRGNASSIMRSQRPVNHAAKLPATTG